jgi:hypothetical protein
MHCLDSLFSVLEHGSFPPNSIVRTSQASDVITNDGNGHEKNFTYKYEKLFFFCSAMLSGKEKPSMPDGSVSLRSNSCLLPMTRFFPGV